MSRLLSEFTTLTFDCYGTLIDWETGIWDALQPLLMESEGGEVSRAEALRVFAEEETELERSSPEMIYSEVLSRVHAALSRRFGRRARKDLDADFGASLPHWPAFPDTAEALRRLKRRYRLVILSNVHREGFFASNRKLGVAFDAIYTAEDIGSFKPSPRNFEFMLERLRVDHGVERGEILHTAQSLFHDHVPARAFGLANAWIDRQGLSQGGDWGATAPVEARPDVDFVFPTLGALADSVQES
ncbi:MAG: haloacid dehalogenase type II [Vicinamibacteria bacterium]